MPAQGLSSLTVVPVASGKETQQPHTWRESVEPKPVEQAVGYILPCRSRSKAQNPGPKSSTTTGRRFCQQARCARSPALLKRAGQKESNTEGVFGEAPVLKL